MKYDTPYIIYESKDYKTNLRNILIVVKSDKNENIVFHINVLNDDVTKSTVQLMNQTLYTKLTGLLSDYGCCAYDLKAGNTYFQDGGEFKITCGTKNYADKIYDHVHQYINAYSDMAANLKNKFMKYTLEDNVKPAHEIHLSVKQVNALLYFLSYKDTKTIFSISDKEHTLKIKK